MIYYGVISVAVLMFSVQFFFNQLFQKNYGNDLQASLVSSLFSGIVGLFSLLIINGFAFEYTHFTLLMSLITAINGFAFTFCSLKALGKINLSLYSVFSMLGGMVLPFLTGILFYNEPLTTGKTICFILIILSLFLTIKKDDKSSGKIYYAGIFILNGLSGVISKIYQDAHYVKASSDGYSVLTVIVTIIISFLILLFIKKEKRKINKQVIISFIGCGSLGRIANWLLLIALLHIPASAQYTFVTGGVMIFSTLISFFTSNKPSVKEILSVLTAFAGLLILILIP